MRKIIFAILLLQCIVCHTRTIPPTITLDAPRRGYWFLSEKYPYQFMRLELYDRHIEGLPSLTMEFRIKVESAGATWQAVGIQGDPLESITDQVHVTYLKPETGTVTLTPVRNTKKYQGHYKSDHLDLPLMEVKLGRNSKIMHFTESEEQMDRLLREKNKLKLDVVWGPTQNEVIEQMFAFTHPTAQDVMFDLGCGDARILLAAARRYGTKGIGYDLDPKLIERGSAMAREQKIDSLITLRTENLFAADLSSATIIAIYLSDRINQKLKPKFFRELKPGTRIVSHNWHMGDWQYDARKFVLDKSRVVYYWIMPANLSGIWLSDDGKTTVTIHQQYQMADVRFRHAEKEWQADGLRIAGKRLNLKNPKFNSEGVLEIIGESVTLKTNAAAIPITLRRQPGSMEPFSM